MHYAWQRMLRFINFVWHFLAPLINIKKAVSTLKTEIKEMDIRIGVLQSIYMQSKIRDKRILDQNLNSPHSGANSFVNIVA